MSTTFGIKTVCLNDKIIPVAHRHNIGGNNIQIDILNPLLYHIPLYVEVIAMDNSSQGIKTIEDIFKCKNIVNSF